MPIGYIDDLVSSFGKDTIDSLGLDKYSSDEYLFNWFRDFDVTLDGEVVRNPWVIEVYHLVGRGFRGVKHIRTVEFESLDDYQKF